MKCRTHSSDGRYYCFPPNVGGFEKSRLCYVPCVATWMSGKQRHSNCSQWPLSAWIHASSLCRHWSVASPTTLCWKLACVSTSRCSNSCVSCGLEHPQSTHTMLLMPQMLSSTGFRSQLLAAHMPGLMKLCFIALDCVTSAMCWCIVLVKDNHVPDAAYCWQQLWCQQHVWIVLSKWQ